MDTKLVREKLEASDLLRYLPCGCVLCICEDDERCHGCGARLCAYHLKQSKLFSHDKAVDKAVEGIVKENPNRTSN